MAFRCLGVLNIAADINVARDDSPLGHDKPWCDDVANDRACRSNVDLLPGSHVSRHRTANRDVLCDQVRCNRGGRSDSQAMVAEFNRPLHVAINRQILSADDLALDSDRPSNPPSQSAFIKRCVGPVASPGRTRSPALSPFLIRSLRSGCQLAIAWLIIPMETAITPALALSTSARQFQPSARHRACSSAVQLSSSSDVLHVRL